MGRSIPAQELTEDWKKVLFNQFHDLAAGSGIGVIYKDAQKDYDVVRWSTNEISSGALKTVAEADRHARRGNSGARIQPAWMGALRRCSRPGATSQAGASNLIVADASAGSKRSFR